MMNPSHQHPTSTLWGINAHVWVFKKIEKHNFFGQNDIGSVPHFFFEKEDISQIVIMLIVTPFCLRNAFGSNEGGGGE